MSPIIQPRPSRTKRHNPATSLVVHGVPPETMRWIDRTAHERGESRAATVRALLTTICVEDEAAHGGDHVAVPFAAMRSAGRR